MWFCQLSSRHLNRDIPIRLPLTGPFCDSLESPETFLPLKETWCAISVATWTLEGASDTRHSLCLRNLWTNFLSSHTVRAVKTAALLFFHLLFLGDATWNSSRPGKWRKECHSQKSWLSPGGEKAAKQQCSQEKIRVNEYNEWSFSRLQNHRLVWIERNLERPSKSNTVFHDIVHKTRLLKAPFNLT